MAKEKLPYSKVIHPVTCHDRDQDKTNPRRLDSLPSTDFDMKTVKLAEVFLADRCYDFPLSSSSLSFGLLSLFHSVYFFFSTP